MVRVASASTSGKGTSNSSQYESPYRQSGASPNKGQCNNARSKTPTGPETSVKTSFKQSKKGAASKKGTCAKCGSVEICAAFDQAKQYECRVCRLESRVNALTQLVSGLIQDKNVLEDNLKSTKQDLEITKDELKNLRELVANKQPGNNQSTAKTSQNAQTGPVHNYASVTARGVKSTSGNDLVTMEVCEHLVAKKLEDRENRKQNVILYNIPESQADTSANRREQDMGNVKQVLARLGVDVKVTKHFRLGRKQSENTGTRPLLVKVESPAEQQLILAKSFKCRDFVLTGCTKQVAISPDRTPEERELLKNLFRQLQERVKNGEEDLVIRKNKIVKRPGKPKPQEEV